MRNRTMLLIFTSLVAGCTFPDFPVYQPGMEPFSAAGGLPWEHAENLDRVRGFPAHNPQPITPMAASVWPAAPTTAPTMLDMLKERKAAPRPTGGAGPPGGAAARGDFGLCLRRLNPGGGNSVPLGVILGVC